MPGVSTASELREKLGKPAHEARWYAWKMLYPSREPLHFDAVHLQESGPEGRIGTIESATIPEGFENREAILAKLGEPELFLTYPGGQHLLDYSEKGVRFTCAPDGITIGAAFFPHGFRRVPPGERRRIDLSMLVQGRRDSLPGVDPRLEVGTAVVDISPTPETYARKFALHDPLRARIAVLRRGDLAVAIAGADIFGMLWSEIEPVETALRKHGIDHLIVAMSHDHAAPDAIGIYGYYPKAYVALIQERVKAGCIEALKNARPAAKLLVSSDDLSLAGARVEGLFRNARNPGIVDPQIAALRFLDADGHPMVTFVHFACHVEGLEKGTDQVSADFPGVLCDRIAQNSGAPAIFLNGALGGMVSGDTRARTFAEAEAKGLRLAREVDRLLGQATHSRSDRFSVERLRVEIPVTNARFIAFQNLAPERRAWVRGRVVSTMFHVRIGDAEILTIPGELLPEVSFEILEHMAGYPRLIVGLANDELGYMIPPYDFRADSYEESMSVGPAIAPVVQRAAERLLGARR